MAKKNEEAYKPQAPLPVSADLMGTSRGIDGWKSSTDPHEGRLPEFGMGEVQCGDSRPACPHCAEEDEGA